MSNKHSFIEFGDPNQKTILFLHGYGDTKELFTPLLEKLQDKYHCISVDLCMNNRPFEKVEFKNLHLHIEEFISKRKIKNITLVGFSLGGLVATKIAHTRPNNVKKLYLLNVLPQILTSKRQYAIYKPLKKFLSSRRIHKASTPVVSKERKPKIPFRPTLFNVIDTNLTDEFNQLNIPKTIALFEDDNIFLYKLAKKILPKIKADIKVFKEGSHASKPIYWDHVQTLFDP
ncbi:alpha/beta fold hydrolase [Patescibacteria group bacterium]